jgi:hypothetical protein
MTNNLMLPQSPVHHRSTDHTPWITACPVPGFKYICTIHTTQPAISPTIIRNIETGEIRHDSVKILRELYPKTQTNRAAGLSEPLILDTQPDLLNGSA